MFSINEIIMIELWYNHLIGIPISKQQSIFDVRKNLKEKKCNMYLLTHNTVSSKVYLVCDKQTYINFI